MSREQVCLPSPSPHPPIPYSSRRPGHRSANAVLPQAHRGLNRRLCDVLASHGTNNPTAPFEKVLVRIIEDTLAIDPSRGAIMVQGWYDWLDGCDRRPPGEINSVEEFIDFRTQNSGFP